MYDPLLKDQVSNSKDYDDIVNEEDKLKHLWCIKKNMYSNGDDDTHMGYDQESHSSVQEYHVNNWKLVLLTISQTKC